MDVDVEDAPAGMANRPILANSLTSFPEKTLTENFMPSVGGPWQGHHCPICICDWEENDKVNVLRCGHYYHVPCFRSAMEMAEDFHRCPTCRDEVFSGYHSHLISEEMMDADPDRFDDLDVDADGDMDDGDLGLDIDNDDLNPSGARAYRTAQVDSFAAWERVSGEEGLNELCEQENKFESRFVDPEAVVAELQPTNLRMRDNDLLNAVANPLRYVQLVAVHLYHRRDEYLNHVQQPFVEDSDFGNFIARVEVALCLLKLEKLVAIGQPRYCTLEQEIDYCRRMVGLHRHLAIVLADASVDNGQQLLHQGYAIIAAAHHGTFLDPSVEISFPLDYAHLGGANGDDEVIVAEFMDHRLYGDVGFEVNSGD